MKTIELRIDETGRGNFKDEPRLFNTISESFESIKELKDHLIERYGKLPHGKNKVHIDTTDGKTLTVGFLHSFWNQDISHISDKWYQTDWITFWEQETTKRYFNL